MKKYFLGKITAIILVFTMLFSLCACVDNSSQTPPEYPKNGEKKIITLSKDIYLDSVTSQPLLVAHYENQSEILLIEINDAVEELINGYLSPFNSGNQVTTQETDSVVTLTRENGAICEIDFVKDTIYFSDFDSFNENNHGANPHDKTSWSYQDENGESVFIKRGSSFFTPGYGILIDLAERNIPLDIYGGKKYIPLQTFNDLFISPYGVNIAYNGEKLFSLMGNTIPDDLMDIYYLDERTERSQALAQFNYDELCLYLDLYYGLQEEHGFNNGFTYYLDKIGLKDKFLELDAINSFNALGTLTLGYIADSHSGVGGASPYLGVKQPEREEIDIKVSNEVVKMASVNEEYKQARAEQLGEVNFYQKVGNTAYITFDSFTLVPRKEYTTAGQIGDTLDIIYWAHKQISEDAEIKNVVVDLSCNGGGAVDSAIYLTAWMLGYCDFSIYDSITQSMATTSYSVDVNLDGNFDEEDTITDKNLYCIVSPVSFSCGNYVPALLQASGNVTIIGKASSGGGCVVRNAVTADGTLFSISDASQMSIVKNGTYYSVDSGVQPDIVLTKIESFYNRDSLTQFINSLM